MNDQTGIELEENAAKLELETLTLPYTFLGEEGNAVLITGIALTEGVWKNVIYSAAELKKVAHKLKGKPILVEHGNTKEFGRKPVGIISNSYYEPSLRAIVFKGKVTDSLAKRLVKKNILPAVSTSTWMNKKPINQEIRIGSQYLFSELSLVRTPACDRCLLPGTKVLSNGFENIENTKLSLSSFGKEQVVKGHLSRLYFGDIIKIKAIGTEEVGITPEHKVLIKRPRKIYSSKNSTYSELGKPIWVKASNLKCFDHLLVPKIQERSIKRKLPIDPEFIGWFIAEGNIRERSIRISQKKKKLVERIRAISPKKDAKLFKDKRKEFWYFDIHDKKLVDFLRQFFTKKKKCLPKWFEKLPLKTLGKFLRGYLQGDGCLEKEKYISCSSNSRSLIDSLRYIFLRFHLYPYLYYQEQPKTFNGYSWISKIWKLKLGPSFSRKLNKIISLNWPIKKTKRKEYLKEDESFFYLPIRNLKREEYLGQIENLETEDNTYTIPFIVHNCFIFHKEQLSALKGKDLKIIKEKEMVGVKGMPEEIETLSEVEWEEEELKEIEELEVPKLYAILELPDEEALDSLRRIKRIVSYYYGYPRYPYYDYPKYPYFKYPYRYPHRRKKRLTDEDKVLLAMVELDNKEELKELRETYNIRKAFYADLGVDHYPDLPSAPLFKPSFHKLSKDSELLTLLKRVVGEQPEITLKKVLEEFISKAPPTAKGQEIPSGPLMEHQRGAPNPEQCKKVTCPIEGKEFENEEKFLEHWKKEHKEQYGPFKETMTILEALGQIVDLAKGDTKIVKMKTGRFVVFVDTGKKGFGQWKIVGNFATEKEARAAVAKVKGKEEKQEEEKDEHGCLVGKEKWDPKEEKCIPLPKEEQSAYTKFIAKCRKEGKSMKECAQEWKKVKVKEEKQKEVVCPACKKKFASEKELAKHWQEKHQEKYGPLKKGYKYPEKKAKAYYYFKHRGKYYPYYYRKGKYYRRYKKPKEK